MTERPEPLGFELSSSELQFQATFARPVFAWLENWTRLTALMFERLQPEGLRLSDIKVEALGSLADFQLTASLLAHSTVVRLRLDSVEVQCYNLTATTEEKIGAVVVDVMEGLQQHAPELEVQSMTTAVGLHGLVSGVPALEFLSRFARTGDLELGPAEGTGTAFYFGESGPRASAVVTVDRSATVADAVFVRLTGVWNASVVQPSELPGLIRGFVDEALAQLNLAIA